MSQPVWQHDCKSCLYLGTIKPRSKDDEPVDCYWCKHGPESAPTNVSMLGRYGNEGHEYASSHPPEAFVGGADDYLVIADRWYLFSLLEATRRGLYAPERKGWLEALRRHFQPAEKVTP